MNLAIYLCLGCMLACGIFAATSRKLIISAVALAVVSAALGVLMYVLGAHSAAIFEVSVCSGLVTVIFISAVSLSNGDRQIEAQDAAEPRRKKRFLPAILIGAGALVMVPPDSPFSPLARRCLLRPARAFNGILGDQPGGYLWPDGCADCWRFRHRCVL